MTRVVTRIVLGLICVIFPLFALSAPQMVTPGSFGVSPHGEATYSVGIQVPPGIAGLEPALTLMYSSDSGNGRLGVDWNLGGTSEIHRCPQTLAQDGGVRAVSMDASDRLCLDGIRLVLVGSGTYGAEGTEYRTEIDGFTKIIAHTSVGSGPTVSNGPAWFEVWTKAGQYKQYGNSTDSRVIAVGVSPATARVWALNRVQDAVSNYMTYTYTQDATNGDYYPAQINYTGNANQSQTPTSQVSFVWAPRPDTVAVYQGGAQIKGTVRLTDIKTYIASGATLVRDYKIAYSTSPATSRSEITSITECPASGACLPATSFTWTNHTIGFNNGGLVAAGKYANWQTSGRIYVGDFNGDGISDLVMGPDASGNWYVMLGNGTGFTDGGLWIANTDAEWVNGANGIRVMDVNGDGLSDIAMGPDANGNWYVLLSTGHSFTDGGAWATGVYANWTGGRNRIYSIDVNGDGKADLVLGPDAAGNWYVLQSDGTKFVDKGAWATGAYGNWVGSVNRTYIADVNGDGLQDVVLGPDGAGCWYVLRSTGTSFTNDGAWICGAHADWANGTDGIRAMDVNGDGLSDIEAGPDANGNWYVMLSTGKKFIDGGAWITGKYAGYVGGRNRIYATDTNGDGLMDLLMGPDAAGNWNVLRSTGTSFVDDGTVLAGAYGNWVSGANDGITRPADINGDGLKDIVMGPDSYGDWYAVTSNPANERITAVNNGLASTSWSFAPLTSSSVYTKDSGANAAVYPIMDLQFPAYVVSQVIAPNGIGGTITTNYTYGGFKTDLTGRGILGPRWTSATRPAVGSFAARTTYTQYNQAYPLNGLVSKVQDSVTGGGNGGLLTEVDNTYQCYSGSTTPVPTTANCALAVGLRYFPYLHQSVQTHWDLNGATFPTVTTTNTFDDWSNATQIVTTTTDGFTKTNNNTYLAADTTHWILGRLSKATVTSTSPQTVPGYLLTIPMNLTATAVAAKQVNLSWTASTNVGGVGIAGYKIYRGGTQIATTTSTTYSDTTTVALTNYTYTVAVYDTGGSTSAQSNAASVTTPAYPLPSAPTGLTGTAVNMNTVSLSWTAGADTGGPGISGYKIYRGGSQIGTSSTTSYTDTTVVASTTYTYTVAEYDTSGNTSAQSSSVQVTTQSVPAPSSPGTPTFSSITTTTATVTWTAATGGPTGYAYSINGGSSWTSVGTALTANLTGLSAGTTYTVQVRASNAGGSGSASSASLVTLPAAPGAPTFSSITATSAIATWTGVTGATSYAYSVNSGSWVSVGTALTASLTGLSAGTTYTVQVHAVDASGSGAASSGTLLTLPSAPGTPTFTSITLTSSTVSWAAATGTVTSYAYSINGGSTWTSLGTARTVNLTGLSSGTKYTVLARATNASGNGASSSASFNTMYTDTPTMTQGTNSATENGFKAAGVDPIGSMSPTTTKNGYSYAQFADHFTAGGLYTQTIFAVSGFTADPGQAWLSSAACGGTSRAGSSGTYVYSSGTASWAWTTGTMFGTDGNVSCTIVHD